MMMKKRIMRKILFVLLPLVLALFASCGEQKYDTPEDGPTFGNITISVDESFRPIFESQLETFHSIYTQAKINVRYVSEAQAVSDLVADSSRMIIISRELSAAENSEIERVKIYPSTIKAAYDAVALVAHKNNKQAFITYEQIEGILRGEITNWRQVDRSLPSSEIQLIFDNYNSGIINYLKSRFGTDAFLKKNSFAVKSSEAVVDYVSKNTNALGFLGVNWISDSDDQKNLSFLKKISVLEVSNPDTSAKGGSYYQPFQAYIATKDYPLTRTVYMISREARKGLAYGFMAFVASERGQRIILKSGLVPATMPIRLVEVRNENFSIERDNNNENTKN